MKVKTLWPFQFGSPSREKTPSYVSLYVCNVAECKNHFKTTIFKDVECVCVCHIYTHHIYTVYTYTYMYIYIQTPCAVQSVFILKLTSVYTSWCRYAKSDKLPLFFPQVWEKKMLQQSVCICSAKTREPKIWAKAFSIMSVVLLSPSVTHTDIRGHTHAARAHTRETWGQATETKPSIPIWWVTRVHACTHARTYVCRHAHTQPKACFLGRSLWQARETTSLSAARRWNQKNVQEQLQLAWQRRCWGLNDEPCTCGCVCACGRVCNEKEKEKEKEKEWGLPHAALSRDGICATE